MIHSWIANELKFGSSKEGGDGQLENELSPSAQGPCRLHRAPQCSVDPLLRRPALHLGGARAPAAAGKSTDFSKLVRALQGPGYNLL